MRTENRLALSQTLDRGLAVLEAVAAADRALAVEDLARALGLHRSIVYRLVRTLEDRHLVERDDGGRYSPGVRLAVLARHVQSGLRSAASGALATLAEELGVTAFLVTRDGGEAITIDSVEPRWVDVHVAYRPGMRHPLDRGAPGLALLAGLPPVVGERAEVTAARAAGWVATEGEVLPGMACVAAPVLDLGAVAVLWLAAQPVDRDVLVRHVVIAAAAIAARLS